MTAQIEPTLTVLEEGVGTLYSKPYDTSFVARVQTATDREVVLSSTLFRHETSEHAGDRGVLAGRPVERVMLAADGSIVHGLADGQYYAKVHVDERVVGEVDWDRRYTMMRLHSAAHLVKFGFEETHGEVDRERLQVRADSARILLSHKLGAEALLPARLSSWLKRAVRDDLIITNWAPRTGQLRRYWHISGIGTVACSGLHPRTTKEIGELTVRFEAISSSRLEVVVRLASTSLLD